MIVQCSACA